MTEGRVMVKAIGARYDRWWLLVASHPPLASPLKGGRDELGRGGGCWARWDTRGERGYDRQRGGGVRD